MRNVHPLGHGGNLFVMPASDARLAITRRITFVADNAQHDLPAIEGDVVVFDATDGRRLVTLDGPTVTARRTAAVSLRAAMVCRCHRAGCCVVRAFTPRMDEWAPRFVASGLISAVWWWWTPQTPTTRPVTCRRRGCRYRTMPGWPMSSTSVRFGGPRPIGAGRSFLRAGAGGLGFCGGPLLQGDHLSARTLDFPTETAAIWMALFFRSLSYG